MGKFERMMNEANAPEFVVEAAADFDAACAAADNNTAAMLDMIVADNEFAAAVNRWHASEWNNEFSAAAR